MCSYHCQVGVTGLKCDKCAVGYFDLQADSATGCKRCWCSGLTNKCTDEDMYWCVPTVCLRNLIVP